MKSLIVMIDDTSPSFCYYASKVRSSAPSRMKPETFLQAMEFAQARNLELNIICPSDGLPEYAGSMLGNERPFVCYFPAGQNDMGETDIPIVEARDARAIASIESGRHEVAILRASTEDIPGLVDGCRALSERVYRVVVVLHGLERCDEATLRNYQVSLEGMSELLSSIYLAGGRAEISVISDRIALTSPRHCNPGIDHLTVAPDGKLYICPGFFVDGAPSIGDLESGEKIINGQLLLLENAPICSICDAFQCRRCIYLNQKATLELNTPSWQQCRAAHAEREVSRVLLDNLHKRQCLRNFKPISTIDYQDPLEILHRVPGRGALGRLPAKAVSATAIDAVLQARKPAAERKPVSASITKEPSMNDDKSIGKVTAEERDQIRQLHLRKNGLTELFGSLAKMDAKTLESTPLYDKLIKDMGEVTLKYQEWWDTMSGKYGWERIKGRNWRVDFESCAVFLENKDK